jgi:hypothetical protein
MPKYLNFESNGSGIAQIKNAQGKLKNKIIYLDSNAKSMNGFNELKIEGENTYFQLLPDLKKNRQIIYVNGHSGSGKTFWIKRYLQEYKKIYPKNEIYCFSPFENDVSFEGVSLKNIKIEPELIQDNLTSKDFENSICVFDDVEALSNRSLRKEVLRIMDDILCTGRHFNVSACVVFHEACNGALTKKVLNESHAIVFFPTTLGTRSLKYLCDQYLGMDKDEIKRLKKLKTRAVAIIKSYPKLVLSEKEIYALCDGSDSDSSESSDSEEEIVFTRKKTTIKKKKDVKFI